MNSANNGVLGTLHKVSGPQTPDVRQKMPLTCPI